MQTNSNNQYDQTRSGQQYSNQYNQARMGQQYSNQYDQQQKVELEHQKLQKKKKSITIAGWCLFALLVVLLSVLLLRSCGNDDPNPNVNSGYAEHQEDPAPALQQPEQAPAQEEGIPQPEQPVQEYVTEPAPPTEPPVVTYEYRYEIIKSDMSWSEAKAACEAKGGYLATITTTEEYETIAQLADQTDLIYLWLGACLPDTNTTWQQAGWITGESWSFENWYPGEPSMWDDDGALEYCLSMWRVKRGPWTFNDQRNDIVASLPSITGKVGYVCEYKIEVVQ